MEKNYKVQVLDKGYVRLIDWLGTDEDIVEAARMSTGKGFISWDPYQTCKKCLCVESLAHPEAPYPGMCEHEWEKAPRGDMGLLDTLWRKKHASPFEQVEMVIEVKAPIMVFREWHRHRTQSFNEFSARYAIMPDEHYIPDVERVQKQSKTNKQGSGEQILAGTAECFRTQLVDEQNDVYTHYMHWVETDGIARELARINTPVSRYSKMRAKANLRNWFQFSNLRMRPSAQWEIRQFANVVGEFLKNLYPRAWSLFEEYDLYGANLSRTELKILRNVLTDYCENRDVYSKALENHGKRLEMGGMKIAEFIEKITNAEEKIIG